MHYHDIVKNDMCNGVGLRSVLFCSGCEANCKGCQNPQTHPFDSGVLFELKDFMELIDSLKPTYIAGLTLCGGEPLHKHNLHTMTLICEVVKDLFPTKTIWCYTGFLWEEVKDLPIMEYIDVLIDGRFVEKLADENYHWAGSTNQRIIKVQESLKQGKVILWKD